MTTEDKFARGLPFGWIGRTAKLAAQRGFDVREALAASGVTDGGDVIRDDSILAPESFLLMCALLINAFDDEMHGTTTARMARGTAAMAARTIAGERDLAHAITTMSRFFDMVGSSCRIRLCRAGAFARIEIRADGDDPSTVVVEELMAHFLLHQFSFFIGFPLPLTDFATTADDHPAHGRTHPFLGCRVGTGQTTAMFFPQAELNLPSQARSAANPLWDAQLFWLEGRIASQAPPDLTLPVSRAVFDQLLEHDLDFRGCCTRLGAETAALRRQLAGERTSFRQLRKVALVERVTPILKAGGNLEDAAAFLNYADARSLRRAIKCASGHSVRGLREPTASAMALPVVRELHRQALRMS